MKIAKKLFSGLIALAMVVSCGIPAIATTDTSVIYVSTQGSDANTGTLAAPLKTIEAARDMARGIDGSVTVEIMGGEYRLTNDISFTEEDSNVTYRAYNGEEVIIKGSAKISLENVSKVTEDSDIYGKLTDGAKENTYVIDLAAEGITQAMLMDGTKANTQYGTVYGYEFNGFYIDDVMQTVAQWPNNRDYAQFEKVNDTTSIVYKEDTCDKWSDETGWWIGMWMPYDYSYFKFGGVSIDTENNILKYIDNPATVFEKTLYSKRWKAYNLIEEMDVPGEYYIDRENRKLYYYSPVDLTNQKIELDKNFERMITIDGADNLTFEGLTFAQSNGAGFSASNVENLTVKNCTFKDIGRTALGIGGGELCQTGKYYTDSEEKQVEHWQRQRKNGSYNVEISGNIFNNIGGTAISISGAGDNDTLTPSGNVIQNNIISNIGYKSVHPAISIGGCGNTVKNNNISKATIGAIYVTGGNNHLIEKNEIYNVMTEVSDWGAFYEGGSDVFRGTEVNYNYIHDLVPDTNKTYEKLSNAKVGIYFDENQQELSAEHNIIKNAPIAFNSNHAGNFLYQYNTAVDCGRALSLHDHPTETGETVTTGALDLTIAQVKELVADNELFYTTYPTLKTFVDTAQNPMKWTVVNENLKINSGDKIGSQAKTFSTMTNNQEVTDYNVFVNPDGQDYRLKADAAIVAKMPNVLNATNFDIDEIGLQNEFALNQNTASFATIFPANGTSISLQDEYNFSWEPALGANNYKLTVATDEAFKNKVFEKTTMQTGAVVTGLSDQTVYYYKVEAENISRELGTTWMSEDGVVEFGVNVDMYEDTATPDKPANLTTGTGVAGNTAEWAAWGIDDELKVGASSANNVYRFTMANDRLTGVEPGYYATGIFLKDRAKTSTSLDEKAFKPLANTTYVFSVKARSVAGNVRVGISNVNKWGSYVIANHPAEGVQIGTDWTEFKTTLSTVDNTEYEYNYVMFGIVTGAASDYVVYDAPTMYLAEEIEYSMSIEGDSRIKVGEDKIYSAEVLNQVGEKGALSQDFEWLVLNEDRTAVEEGLTILKNADGTATLTGAKAGIYTVIARTADGFTKGMKVKVVSDYNDTESPAKPANLISGGGAAGSTTTIWTADGIPEEMAEGTNWAIKLGMDSDRLEGVDTNWYATGIFLKDKNKNEETQSANAFKPLANTNYVFQVKARAAEGNVKIGLANINTWGNYVVADHGKDGVQVGTDWTDVKTTLSTKDTSAYNFNYLSFGIVTGAASDYIVYDANSMYLAEEIAYSMNIEGDSKIMIGEEKTYSAEIFNQLGLKGNLTQDFEWTVLNADRTQTVEGLEVTENADGTVSVVGTKLGNYTLLATSEEYEFVKGIEVEITSAEDTASPERPANILSKSVEIGDGNKFQNTVGALTSQGVVGRTDNTATKVHNFTASDSTSGNWLYLKGAYVKKAEYKVAEGQDPATAFEAGENYIMSMWVKDARASEDIKRTQFTASISYGAEGSEARKKVYTAEYPKGTNLELNDEWQEFKGSFTMPDDYYTLQYGLFFGQPEELGSEAGQGFVIDDIFVEKEVAYSMNIQGDSRVAVGEEKIYSAELLNQVGEKGTLSQDFNWKLVSEDRSTLADGATLVENADGTVTVTGVEAGTYTLLAISESGFIKGKIIKVLADYSDTESPERPANILSKSVEIGDGNKFQNIFGDLTSQGVVGRTDNTATKVHNFTASDSTSGNWIYLKGAYVKKAEYKVAEGQDPATAFEAGENYIMSMWVKDARASEDIKRTQFTASISYGAEGSQARKKVYTAEYPKGTNLELNDEWQEFKGSFTMPDDYYTLQYGLLFGQPEELGSEAGQGFVIDDIFVEKEIAYSMNIVGDAEIEAGVEKTYSAELLNQIGTKGALPQDFEWLVLDEDRNGLADGLTLVENADGTVTVKGVEAGTYTLLAMSETEDFIKGYTVTVTAGEEPQEKIASAEFVKSGTSVNFKATVENTDAEKVFFVIGEFNGNSLVQAVKSDVKAASDANCDLTLENVTVGNTIRAFIWNNGTLLPIDNVDNLALEYVVTE